MRLTWRRAAAIAGFLLVASRGTAKENGAQPGMAAPQKNEKPARWTAEKANALAGAGRGVKVAEKDDAKHGKMKWIVAEDGGIRGWNEKNALEVTFTPLLQSGKANWNCRGFPITVMPPNCGGRS